MLNDPNSRDVSTQPCALAEQAYVDTIAYAWARTMFTILFVLT